MISTAFAQSAATAPQSALTPSPDLLSMGLPLLFMLGIYMLIIRPQNKRLNEQKKMVDALKLGDEIVTTAGLMGIVGAIKDDFIHLKVAEGLELLLQRQSVQHILPKGTVKLPATTTLKLSKN
ncbi:MAG: preprotein translocase subunit YajC [Pseudomonadota bacterium]